MRHVEHDAGHRGAQRVEDGIERFSAEVIDAIQRRRRGQQVEMVGAFRQQPVDERGIDAIRRENGIGNALRRILIVVEACGAEGEIEIGDDRIQRKVAGDGPGDVVRDGGGADAALGADNRDDAANGLGFGNGEQATDRAHDVERRDRRDQIVADATADEFTIQRDVIDAADDDDAGAGVTHARELIEPAEYVAASFGLEHDNVRRRRGAVGFGRGGETAHLDLEMGLRQTTILAASLHCCGGLDRFAERLHRDARRRSDMLVGDRRSRFVFLVLAGVVDHFARSLNLALVVSG